MIKAFCAFYNEATLIPFFLTHYHYVDAFHAIVERASIDDTRALLAADARVTIQDVTMPDGMDDDLKVGWLNAALAVTDPYHDWHFVVDADEFLFPPGDPGGLSARTYLASVPRSAAILPAALPNVFRHATDDDLDVTRTPIVLQRRHGITDAEHVKPIVIRANRGLAFRPGNHRLRGVEPISSTHHFDGAHWQNADPSFAITRRVRDRKEHMSAANHQKGHGWHHWTKTAADVAQELEAHRHDAAVF